MPKLSAAQFKPAEYESNAYVAHPEAGEAFEEVLQPIYWAHVARSLRPWDKIDIRPADFSYYAELIVTASGPQWAKVAVLRKVDFGKNDKAAETLIPDGYDIKHRGAAGWCVVRLEDREVLHEKAGTKADAAQWLAKHLKTINA